jgi:hypothetical protein
LQKEALSLYDTLRDVEKKRDDLINEEKNRGTPAQERERLLNQVPLRLSWTSKEQFSGMDKSFFWTGQNTFYYLVETKCTLHK